MKRYLAACAVLALAACSKPAEPAKTDAVKAPAPAAAPASTAPAGAYVLDPAHTNVSFKVNHLGFSHYTAGFDHVEGKLNFDPANPTAMVVEATIDPTSLDLNAPPEGFHGELMGAGYFDAKTFLTINFKSTKVEPTGPATANVTGDLTLHGVTRPVTPGGDLQRRLGGQSLRRRADRVLRPWDAQALRLRHGGGRSGAGLQHGRQRRGRGHDRDRVRQRDQDGRAVPAAGLGAASRERLGQEKAAVSPFRMKKHESSGPRARLNSDRGCES